MAASARPPNDNTEEIGFLPVLYVRKSRDGWALTTVQVSPECSSSSSCCGPWRLGPPRARGRGPRRRPVAIPIGRRRSGSGRSRRSAECASSNTKARVCSLGVVDDQGVLPHVGDRDELKPAVGAPRRRAPPRCRIESAARAQRIWFSSRWPLADRVEGAVVEDVAVLVDLDERRAAVGGGRAQGCGHVRLVGVHRARHEARLGPGRQRHRIERVVLRPERRGLSDLALLARRRVLPLGEPVDLVVEEQDLQRHVAAGVDQVVAADRARRRRRSPTPTDRAARWPRRWRAPARGRGCRASRTCPCSRRTGPRSRAGHEHDPVRRDAEAPA